MCFLFATYSMVCTVASSTDAHTRLLKKLHIPKKLFAVQQTQLQLFALYLDMPCKFFPYTLAITQQMKMQKCQNWIQWSGSTAAEDLAPALHAVSLSLRLQASKIHW